MTKSAVITGATKGIGLALSKVFASNGFHLAICSRSEEDLNKVKQEIEQVHSDVVVNTFVCDVSKKNAVQDFADFVNQTFEKVDVLVNNAGVFMPGGVLEEEDGNFELMMHTNVFSAYYLTRWLKEGLGKSDKAHIFNVCSTASLMAYPSGGSYATSKFALYGLSKSLREELKEKGVRVTSVLPGATKTASWDGVDLPDERFMDTADLAAMVWQTYNLSFRSVVEDIVMRPQLGDIL